MKWLNKFILRCYRRGLAEEENNTVNFDDMGFPNVLQSSYDNTKYFGFRLYRADGGIVVEVSSAIGNGNSRSDNRLNLYIIPDDTKSFAEDLARIVLHERIKS